MGRKTAHSRSVGYGPSTGHPYPGLAGLVSTLFGAVTWGVKTAFVSGVTAQREIDGRVKL